MPGMTSLGITYPCGGDTLDSAAFQTYADTTQDALDATQSLIDSAFSPPTVLVATSPPGQVIAAGVTATMAYQDVTYNAFAMYNAGSPTLITIQSAGTYLVNLWSSRTVQPTTHTSSRAAILLGGVEQAYHKSDDGTASFSAAPQFMVSAVLPGLSVGNQITTTFLFTGTGNITVRHSVSVTKISDV
jgi:hypothetical protein